MSLETWFKALADPTRLRILSLTLSRELNVQELMEVLSMGQSRVSRHLRILTDGGLLTCRRDGLWAFYRVPADGAGARASWTRWPPCWPATRSWTRTAEHAAELAAAGRGRARKFFDALAPEWDRRKAELLGGCRPGERGAGAPAGLRGGGRPGLRDRGPAGRHGGEGRHGHRRGLLPADAGAGPPGLRGSEPERAAAPRGAGAPAPAGGRRRTRRC